MPWPCVVCRYGKLITSSLGLEGEINDVREVDAEEMEWYWEVGAK